MMIFDYSNPNSSQQTPDYCSVYILTEHTAFHSGYVFPHYDVPNSLFAGHESPSPTAPRGSSSLATSLCLSKCSGGIIYWTKI